MEIVNIVVSADSVPDPDPAWIRIRFVSWIRIRIPNANPDPATDEISSKSPKNSYYLGLFD